jgi:5'(3')-deoxyribonucleotidase
MEKQIKIAFDLDGVVINLSGSFLYTAQKKFNILHGVTSKDIVRYEYSECIDISYEMCWKIIDYILQNPLECNLGPVKGAVETLTLLSKYMDLLFVTARKDTCIKQTKEIIHSYFPDVDKNKIKIIHTRGSKKHEVLKKFGTEYFVDDRTRNCRFLEQNGIKSLLLDSPWNQNKESFFRVKNWNEISEFIFEKVIE